MKCSKSGIKIHESNNSSNNTNNNIFNNKNSNTYLDPDEFYNKLKNQNKHTGVRIEKSNNDYIENPFGNINPFNNPNPNPNNRKDIDNIQYDKSAYNKLDLNINNYSADDLYKLFGINTTNLTENIMREAKKLVLKTHPDKSQLEPKYFLFFSAAYKRLHSIYTFQNKTEKIVINDQNFVPVPESGHGEEEHLSILSNMFNKNPKLKEPVHFNNWFNEQFEKNKLEDSNENGYGDWLKSEDDLPNINNVTQANMNSKIETYKKQVQSMIVYNGINDLYASSFGGSTLMNLDNNNYTSGSIFSNEGMGYTDLRQAYVESVIPITAEDYQKVPKFNNIDDYKRHRENVDIKPIDKQIAMQKLYERNKELDQESTALAFHYAQQSEKVKKNNDSFWSGLKQLTNW